jgi:hypothetical protein
VTGTSVACCPPDAPFYCPSNNNCYATASVAYSACGNVPHTCLACGEPVVPDSGPSEDGGPDASPPDDSSTPDAPFEASTPDASDGGADAAPEDASDANAQDAGDAEAPDASDAAPE